MEIKINLLVDKQAKTNPEINQALNGAWYNWKRYYIVKQGTQDEFGNDQYSRVILTWIDRFKHLFSDQFQKLSAQYPDNRTLTKLELTARLKKVDRISSHVFKGNKRSSGPVDSQDAHQPKTISDQKIKNFTIKFYEKHDTSAPEREKTKEIKNEFFEKISDISKNSHFKTNPKAFKENWDKEKLGKFPRIADRLVSQWLQSWIEQAQISPNPQSNEDNTDAVELEEDPVTITINEADPSSNIQKNAEQEEQEIIINETDPSSNTQKDAEQEEQEMLEEAIASALNSKEFKENPTAYYEKLLQEKAKRTTYELWPDDEVLKAVEQEIEKGKELEREKELLKIPGFGAEKVAGKDLSSDQWQAIKSLAQAFANTHVSQCSLTNNIFEVNFYWYYILDAIRSKVYQEDPLKYVAAHELKLKQDKIIRPGTWGALSFLKEPELLEKLRSWNL